MLAATAPLVKEFEDPGPAIQEVIVGLCHAAVVRNYLAPDEAEAQAERILEKYDRRTDGVPGGTLGPSLFEHQEEPFEYFRESALAGGRIMEVLGSAHPAHLLRAIESFEEKNPDYQVRPVVFKGLPAAYNRALIFPRTEATVVPIHEDVANVRALGPHGFEIAGVEIVLAHNLYLRNTLGEASLYMYSKRFSEAEKRELDKSLGEGSSIAQQGFPYPEEALKEAKVTCLDVEAGDYVVFRADHPHKVASKGGGSPGFRVSWNGFFAPLFGANKHLVYWT